MKISVLTIPLIVSFADYSKSKTTVNDKTTKTFSNPVWDDADPWMVKNGTPDFGQPIPPGSRINLPSGEL